MSEAPEGELLYRESFHITGNDFEHGGDVATSIKATLKQLGLPQAAIRRLSIANFEAEMNVIMYARRAEVTFEIFPDRVAIEVRDEGPGIPDIEWAMQEGHSTATAAMRERGFGAGLGLPNIRRNSDDFAIDSVVDRGTTLRYAVRLAV